MKKYDPIKISNLSIQILNWLKDAAKEYDYLEQQAALKTAAECLGNSFNAASVFAMATNILRK